MPRYASDHQDVSVCPTSLPFLPSPPLPSRRVSTPPHSFFLPTLCLYFSVLQVGAKYNFDPKYLKEVRISLHPFRYPPLPPLSHPFLLTPFLSPSSPPPFTLSLQVASLRSEDADLSDKGYAQAELLGEHLEERLRGRR